VKKPQKNKAPVDNKTSGVKDIPTAQIDALTASGARFASGYFISPFCEASRGALMTGRYQTRFGFAFNPIGVNQGKEICGDYDVSVRRLEQIP
jgi:arylsulfatase A-like enzyme